MRKFLILLAYSALCCGCYLEPQEDNSHFYALGINQSGTKGDVSCKDCLKVVCLDLEEIPSYSDVSQFVALKDGCEIVRSELLRWGEPFKTSVERALYSGLSNQLKGNYFVVLSPVKQPQEYDYRVSVKVMNFIFDQDRNEIRLGAVITMTKKGDPYAICDYSDCLQVGSNDPKAIVDGMNWALNTMSAFIGRCLTPHVDMHVLEEEVPQSEDSQVDVQDADSDENDLSVSQEELSEQSRIIELISHGEVYVTVDSEDGEIRYFSGRLYDGSSVNVRCDGPFKVTSTDDSLIEIR